MSFILQPSSGGGAVAQEYLYARDQQANGVNGGASVAGFQTRTLNTVVNNSITGASLAANLITLPAGTYRVSARAPSVFGSKIKLSLYNNTLAANILIGSSVGFGMGTIDSVVNGSFVLAATNDISLRFYSDTTLAGHGLGGAVSNGEIEVYSEIELIKTA